MTPEQRADAVQRVTIERHAQWKIKTYDSRAGTTQAFVTMTESDAALVQILHEEIAEAVGAAEAEKDRQIAALVGALKKYGWHDECPNDVKLPGCSCGWREFKESLSDLSSAAAAHDARVRAGALSAFARVVEAGSKREWTDEEVVACLLACAATALKERP